MPSQVLVDSGYPALTFFVNDVGQDSLFSITVKSGEGILKTGTVLELDSGTGKYVEYTSGTATGILLNRTDATNGDELGSQLVMGVVRSGSLFSNGQAVGIDANGMTDLENHFIFV
jgi:hypothetical protein